MLELSLAQWDCGWPLLARVTWQSRCNPEGLEGRKGSCAVTDGPLESSPVLSCQIVVGSRGIVSGTLPSLGFVTLGSWPYEGFSLWVRGALYPCCLLLESVLQKAAEMVMNACHAPLAGHAIISTRSSFTLAMLC